MLELLVDLIVLDVIDGNRRKRPMIYDPKTIAAASDTELPPHAGYAPPLGLIVEYFTP